MKKIIVIILIFTSSSTLCFSQDVITKKTGEDIQAKILEVNQTELKYKKFDNLTGPTFTILKSEVLMVRYENGTKDIFNDGKSNKVSNNSDSSNIDFFAQGKTDASRNYKRYKGAGTGTLITSLAIPLVGLIPAITCSSTQPKDENLGFPNSNLMKNPDYYNGYTRRAKKIKQGKVWTNWGIGFGVNIAAALIIISNQ